MEMNGQDPTAKKLAEILARNKFPEHAKMQKFGQQPIIIGNFLEWLTSNYVICDEFENDAGEVEFAGLAQKPIEHWLSEYFQIDLEKIIKERQAMALEAATQELPKKGIILQ